MFYPRNLALLCGFCTVICSHSLKPKMRCHHLVKRLTLTDFSQAFCSVDMFQRIKNSWIFRRNGCGGLDVKLNHLFLQGCRIFGMGNNREVMMQAVSLNKIIFLNEAAWTCQLGKVLSLIFCKGLSLTLDVNCHQFSVIILAPFFSKEEESFYQNSSFILRTIDKDSDNI